jgi:UDP-glucose 4-epimerase
MRDFKILITGGAGFIGSHLAARLAPHNKVVVLDDLSSGSRQNLKGIPVKFVKGSIMNKELVFRAAKGMDYVFHLAAVAAVQNSVVDPEHCFKVNILGSMNVINACVSTKVRKFFFSSSAAVYGDSPGLPKTETTLPVPMSPYAASKLAVEHQSIVNYQLYGLRFACLRLFNVYGPRQDPASPYSGVISKFMEAAISGKPLTIFGDGRQTRDFIYVDDVVSAFIAGAKSQNVGVFNIAGGESVTINQIARQLVELAASKSKIEREPYRPGDIRHSLASIEKAMHGLAWSPRVGMKEGLTETLKWFRGAK